MDIPWYPWDIHGTTRSSHPGPPLDIPPGSPQDILPGPPQDILPQHPWDIPPGPPRNNPPGHPWNIPPGSPWDIPAEPQGHGGRAACTLTPHQGEPGSIPGRVTRLSQVGIVPDDAVGRRVSSGISRFPPPPPLLRHSIFTSITLIGSQNLAVKSRLNLFTSHCPKLGDVCRQAMLFPIHCACAYTDMLVGVRWIVEKLPDFAPLVAPPCTGVIERSCSLAALLTSARTHHTCTQHLSRVLMLAALNCRANAFRMRRMQAHTSSLTSVVGLYGNSEIVGGAGKSVALKTTDR
ncbi:hypothetical protein PR048_017807 [Dryococelus australis]|uniref:Uncharacterized protein n=1 Tax=Dryococelus australis TaxID=614101 RepID=A0ABQ9HAH8_9NEOP|nr:hypothetical protein PR048_017807 [Dryococelus australis]